MKEVKTINQKVKEILPGLSLSFIVAVIAKCLANYIPKLGGATIAILLGIVLGNTVFTQPELDKGTKFAESRLLEYSVCLLGFTVTFKTISQIGINGVVYIILMMTTVIICAYIIGKKMGFSENMSMMMAGGNAVCGSSAIGAIAPVIGADDEEKGQIITLVNLMGTVMMLTLPALAIALYGSNVISKSALLGGTLQSVGQVVAGASLVNQATVKFSMIFKITRIIFLVVVVYVFGKKAEKNNAGAATSTTKVRIPWYIVIFLIFCVINSCFKLPPIINQTAQFLSTWFETTALAAIGLRLNFKKFMAEGKRFLIYGLSVGVVQVIAAISFIYLLKVK